LTIRPSIGAGVIPLEREPDDGAAFFDAIVPLLIGAVDVVRPARVYVVKVDHWFDHKWLSFTGKFLGAVGTWKRELTLPPFHPHRVKWQRHYSRGPGGDFHFDGGGEPLAVEQASSDNHRRYVSCRPFRSSLMAWFSGGTESFDRGALMVYTNTPSDRPGHVHTAGWYASFAAAGARAGAAAPWRLHRNKGVSPGELAAFANRARLIPVP
jgi:hypothetical protein